MTDDRTLTRSDYLRLKAATRKLISLCGGVEGAAASTRVNKSVLSDYGNPNKDQFAPLDVIADLETVAGKTPVTTLLAEISHHVLADVAAADPSPGDALAIIGGISKETSDVVALLAKALADGVIDADERAALAKEISEAETVLANLRQIVTNCSEGIEVVSFKKEGAA